MDDPPAASLIDLPHSVVARILQLLLGRGAGAGSGGTKDCVQLAFSCKAMMEAVAAAEPLWQEQCSRLGWRWAGPGQVLWWWRRQWQRWSRVPAACRF